jgi:hypothetical protein
MPQLDGCIKRNDCAYEVGRSTCCFIELPTGTAAKVAIRGGRRPPSVRRYLGRHEDSIGHGLLDRMVGEIDLGERRHAG